MRGTTTLSRVLFLSSTTSSLPLLLLLLLLIGIGFIGIVGVATAVDLPLSVQDSTYNSADDTVPSQGTTLLVPSMLHDAVSKNLSTASFTAINLEFVGVLEIKLPATDADWAYTTNTTNTTVLPALLVLIQNGRSWVNFTHPTLPPPSAFITISGVLSSESNITIQGGLYNYTQSFINCSQGLFLRNSAVLVVVGGTFHTFYPCEGGLDMYYLASFIHADTIDVTNGSLLHIANNAMLVENFTCRRYVYDFLRFGSSVLSPREVLSISTSSSVIVIHNMFALPHISTYFRWAVVYQQCADNTCPYVGKSKATLSVSTLSSFLVSHNHVSIYTGIITSYWQFWLHFIALDGVFMEGGSTVSISYNEVIVQNAIVTSEPSVILFADAIVMSSSSELFVDNNNLTMSTIGGSPRSAVTYIRQHLRVYEGSTFSNSHNVVYLHRVEASNYEYVVVGVSILIANAVNSSVQSLILLKNNTAHVLAVFNNYTIAPCALLSVPTLTLTNASTIYITHNVVTGSSSASLLEASSSLFVAYNSSVWVEDNHIRDGGSILLDSGGGYRNSVSIRYFSGVYAMRNIFNADGSVHGIYAPQFALEESSVFSVSDNIIYRFITSRSILINLVVANISSNSTVLVTNNSVSHVLYKNAVSRFFYLVSVPTLTLTNASTIYITHNVVTGSSSASLLEASSSLFVAYNSSVWVEDNHIRDGGSILLDSGGDYRDSVSIRYFSGVYAMRNIFNADISRNEYGIRVRQFSLEESSVFFVSDNIIYQRTSLYLIRLDVATISSNSTLLVTSNTITIDDSSESWSVVLRLLMGRLAVESSSAVHIEGNVGVLNYISARFVDFAFLYFFFYTVGNTIGAFSTISVFNNSVVASDITGMEWSMSFVRFESVPLTLPSSTLSISSNILTLKNSRFTSSSVSNVIDLGSSSTTLGAIVLDNNILSASNVSVDVLSTSRWEMGVFVTRAATTHTIGGGASLTVINNSLLTSNIPKFYTITPTLFMCKISDGITVNGRMEIVRNTAGSGTLFYINTMLDGTGVVSLTNNVMRGAQSSVVTVGNNGLGATPNTPFTIYTCRNYVTESVCRMNDETHSSYSCVVGSSEQMEISDCTPFPPPENSSSSSTPLSSSSIANEPSTPSMLSSSSPGAVPVSPVNTSSTSSMMSAASSPPPPPTTSSLTSASATSASSSSSPQKNSPRSSTDGSSSSAGSTVVGTTNRTCPATHNSPCPYATSTLLSTNNITASTISSQYLSSSSNGGISKTPTTTNVGCMPSASGLSVTVPFPTWSEGSPFFIYILLSRPLTKEFTSSFNDVGHAVDTTMDSTNHLQYRHFLKWEMSKSSSSADEDMLWIAIEIGYTGVYTRSSKKSALSLPLPPSRFNCSFNSSISRNVSLEVVLEEGSSIPAVVVTVLNVALSAGIMTVVPSSIVRAGMMETIVQLLRCEEFDPQEEVGLVNNPFMWAPGREELPYHRGSVMFAFILLGLLTVSMIIMILVSRVRSRSWKSAMEAVRIPSLALIVIVILAEVGVSSAISMMYGGGDAKDITVSLLVLIPICAYISLYTYTTAKSSRYVVSVPAQQQAATDKTTTTDTNANNTTSSPPPHNNNVEQKGRIKRFLHYVLEPTHDTVLVPIILVDADDDEDAISFNSTTVSEGWFRCNFYFVVERRWALYGSLELIGGTLTNILEGIPMTTSDRTVCIARPACIMVISSTLFALLLWKSPNTVRLQQWCGVFVMGGMTLTSTLALVNAITPSEDLMAVIEYMGLVVVSVSIILGLLEAVILAVTYIPLIRELLSLRPRDLQAVINTSKKHQQADHDAFIGGLQVPMLAITADDSIPPPNTSNKVDPDDDDDLHLLHIDAKTTTSPAQPPQASATAPRTSSASTRLSASKGKHKKNSPVARVNKKPQLSLDLDDDLIKEIVADVGTSGKANSVDQDDDDSAEFVL